MEISTCFNISNNYIRSSRRKFSRHLFIFQSCLERVGDKRVREKLAKSRFFFFFQGDKLETLKRFKNRERDYSTRHQNGSRYHNRDNNEAFYGKRGWDERKYSPAGPPPTRPVIIRFHPSRGVPFNLILRTPGFCKWIKFCLFYIPRF